jgi:DNA-binding beta-propeller fold protein YncE
VATAEIHVKVLTLDPVSGAPIPVEGVQVKCRNSRFLIDGTLSTASPTTDVQGRAKVPISFEDGAEQSLNPYFELSVPQAKRAVPAGAPATRQVTLPGDWETRHAVNRRLPRITLFTDPNAPLELFVGLPGDVRVAYTDYHSFDGTTRTGLRNPLALPQDSAAVRLIDSDLIFDDALGGFRFDRTDNKVVALGEAGYRYADEFPTAPWAMDLTPPPGPRAWLDPPGAPVGRLGGGSFRHVGPLAIDLRGFVFMVDGAVVRRLYPDGTLAETISTNLAAPKGVALDSYRNLFVADGNKIEIFRPDFYENGLGIYRHEATAATGGALNDPCGLAVLPSRVVDGDELLAVADAANARVRVFTIAITDFTPSTLSRRAMRRQSVTLTARALVGAGALGEPVAVAADPQRRLYVCDRTRHAVARFDPDATFSAWTPGPVTGRAGGTAGAGAAEFDTPEAVAVDPKEGYLYVAESGNRRVQRLDAATGAHRTHWTTPYPAALPNPFTPGGVAVDPCGDVFAADTANDRVVRGHPYSPAGAPLAAAAVPTTVGTPWTPAGEAGHMAAPAYLHLAADGRLWVADTGSDRVLAFKRDPATGDLEPETLAAPPAGLSKPRGIATDADGNLFVVDGANHLRVYDPALAVKADAGPSAPASADDLDDPRGITVVQRAEPLVYIADRTKNRVQVRRRDGTFVKHLPAPPSPLLNPEDVTADSHGNVFVADTGNRRIVQYAPDDTFARAVGLVPPSGGTGITFGRPVGVTAEPGGTLLVTDSGLRAVLRIRLDGTLVTWWDLETLTRHGTPAAGAPASLSPGRGRRYEPELARLVTFEAPAKAVMDARGLLAVADPALDHVRLVRTRTTLDLALFDLGERLPDISLHASSEANWRSQFGLAAGVVHVRIDWPAWFGDVLWHSDAHSFTSEPEDDFAGDRYAQERVLNDARSTSTAVNVLRVVRDAQRWLKHLTRFDASEHRWGAEPAKLPALYVDLEKEEGSFHRWGSEAIHMGSDRAGRGIDAWDDSVVVHEMTHWIMDFSVDPKVPYRRDGGDHQIDQMRNASIAITEGYAEYHQGFWGSEFGRWDAIRGFALAGTYTLRDVFRTVSGAAVNTYLYGGPSTAALPTFTVANEAVECEGYFCNALWQIHHALAEPGILLADQPTYWYGYNAVVDNAQGDRYARVMRRSLRSFPRNPSDDEFRLGSRAYARQLLRQARLVSARSVEIVESILELNNLANPSLGVTRGTSTTAPGTNIPGDKLIVVQNTTHDLIVQVTDLDGQPLSGYQVTATVTGVAGATAGTLVFNGPTPARRHGAAPAGSTGRPTNVVGIVNLTYSAPAAPATLKNQIVFSVQPDFDDDATFAPPQPGDDLETTRTQLYLYELRGANKTWAGTGSNRGAIIAKTVEIEVRTA